MNVKLGLLPHRKIT